MILYKSKRHRPGIVHQHVDSAEAFNGRGSRNAHLIDIRDICAHRHCDTAGGADALNHVIQQCDADVRADQLCSHRCGLLRDEAPEAAPSAGDDDHLFANITHYSLF